MLKFDQVLTAAHCADFLRKSVNVLPVQILAGRHNLSLTEKEENGQSRSVEKFIVHKNFKLERKGACDDIGLIKVAEPFEFNKNVTSIRLPSANETPKGESTLFGWGNISTNKTHVDPSVLQVCIISYSLHGIALKSFSDC